MFNENVSTNIWDFWSRRFAISDVRNIHTQILGYRLQICDLGCHKCLYFNFQEKIINKNNRIFAICFRNLRANIWDRKDQRVAISDVTNMCTLIFRYKFQILVLGYLWSAPWKLKYKYFWFPTSISDITHTTNFGYRLRISEYLNILLQKFK